MYIEGVKLHPRHTHLVVRQQRSTSLNGGDIIFVSQLKHSAAPLLQDIEAIGSKLKYDM